MKYEVIVAGTINSIHETKKEAEKRVKEIRNSIFGMIHPVDAIYIRKVESL